VCDRTLSTSRVRTHAKESQRLEQNGFDVFVAFAFLITKFNILRKILIYPKFRVDVDVAKIKRKEL
jgi:hypothetical protein